MTKLKKWMIKSMGKIMLNCESATLLATRGEFEQLGFFNRMKLKMHLITCKFCRNFSEQSKTINSQLVDIKCIDPLKLRLHLSEEQKCRLNKTIGKQVTEN